MAVLLPLGSALLVHVRRYVWSQKLRLQLTQGNVDQREFGAGAIGQTSGLVVSCFLIQTLRNRGQLVELVRGARLQVGGATWL